MKADMNKQAEQYIRQTKKRKLFDKILATLSVVVALSTTYVLMAPGVTMNRDTTCGLAEHTHDASCYQQVLTCGQEESEGTAAYSSFTCSWKPHKHTQACYDLPENDGQSSHLICGKNEAVLHSHNDFCYDAEGNRVCKLGARHFHSDACYKKTPGALICTRPVVLESATPSDLHEHSVAAGCYAMNDEIICDYPDHTHHSSCYVDEVVAEGQESRRICICGYRTPAKHQHSEECWTAHAAVPGHQHSETCYTQTLVCELTEHVHDEALCYAVATKAPDETMQPESAEVDDSVVDAEETTEVDLENETAETVIETETAQNEIDEETIETVVNAEENAGSEAAAEVIENVAEDPADLPVEETVDKSETTEDAVEQPIDVSDVPVDQETEKTEVDIETTEPTVVETPSDSIEEPTAVVDVPELLPMESAAVENVEEVEEADELEDLIEETEDEFAAVTLEEPGYSYVPNASASITNIIFDSINDQHDGTFKVDMSAKVQVKVADARQAVIGPGNTVLATKMSGVDVPDSLLNKWRDGKDATWNGKGAPFQYKFVKNSDGTFSILMKFEKGYIDANWNKSTLNGSMSFSAEVREENIRDDGKVPIYVGTDTSEIPVLTTEPGDSFGKHKIKAEKSGSIKKDTTTDRYYVEYTIAALQMGGTFGKTIDISDQFTTANTGMTLVADSVKYAPVETYENNGLVYYGVDENQFRALNITQTSDGFKASLPAVADNNNTGYVVRVSYDVTDLIDGGEIDSVTNHVKASIGTSPKKISDEADSTVNDLTKQRTLTSSKSGSLSADHKSITWRITVTNNDTNIGGKVLKDDFLTNIAWDDITITPNKENWEFNKSAGTLTNKQTMDKGSYVFEYTTAVETDKQWPQDKDEYIPNSYTFDEEPGGITVKIDKVKPLTIEKSGSLKQDDHSSITWTIKINNDHTDLANKTLTESMFNDPVHPNRQIESITWTATDSGNNSTSKPDVWTKDGDGLKHDGSEDYNSYTITIVEKIPEADRYPETPAEYSNTAGLGNASDGDTVGISARSLDLDKTGWLHTPDRDYIEWNVYITSDHYELATGEEETPKKLTDNALYAFDASNITITKGPNRDQQNTYNWQADWQFSKDETNKLGCLTYIGSSTANELVTYRITYRRNLAENERYPSEDTTYPNRVDFENKFKDAPVTVPGIQDGINWLDKSVISNLANSEGNEVLTWKAVINVNADGWLLADTVFTDTLYGVDAYSANVDEHYMTGAQVKAVKEALLQAGITADVSAMNGTDVIAWDNISDDVHYNGFKFKITASRHFDNMTNLEFNYESVAVITLDIRNSNNETKFRNKLEENDKEKVGEWTRKIPLTKKNGGYQTQPSTQDISNENKITWYVEYVAPHSDVNTVTIVDALPASAEVAIELVKLSFSNNDLPTTGEIRNIDGVNVKATTEMKTDDHGVEYQTVKVEITAPEGQTLRTDNAYRIMYECQIKDLDEILANLHLNVGDTVELIVAENSVRIENDNSIPPKSQTQTITYTEPEPPQAQALKKTVTWESGFENNTLHYRLEINRNGEELNHGNPLTVTDSFYINDKYIANDHFYDRFAWLEQTSIKLYSASLDANGKPILQNVDGEEQLLKGAPVSSSQWDIVDISTHVHENTSIGEKVGGLDYEYIWGNPNQISNILETTMTLSVPDGHAYILEYDYKVKMESVNGVYLNKPINGKNIATLQGEYNDSSESKNEYKKEDSSIDLGGVAVYKVEAGKPSEKLLGAEFTVYKKSEPSTPLYVYQATDGSFYLDRTFEVDGKLLYDWNEAYYLVETKAPAGYRIDNTPIYFYWLNNQAPSGWVESNLAGIPPEQIYDLSSGNVPPILVPNEKDTPTRVLLRKNWDDDNDKSHRPDSIRVTLKRYALNDADFAGLATEVKEISRKRNVTVHLENGSNSGGYMQPGGSEITRTVETAGDIAFTIYCPNTEINSWAAKVAPRIIVNGVDTGMSLGNIVGGSNNTYNYSIPDGVSEIFIKLLFSDGGTWSNNLDGWELTVSDRGTGSSSDKEYVTSYTDAAWNTIKNHPSVELNYDTVSLNGSNGWAKQWNNLFSVGVENGVPVHYVYAVDEALVEGYDGEVEILGTTENGYTVQMTNTRTDSTYEFTKISVEKKWYDLNGQPVENFNGVNSINLYLYQTDLKTGIESNYRYEGEEFKTINGVNHGWKYEYNDLPYSKNGEILYSYRVVEGTIDGYYSKYFVNGQQQSNAIPTTILNPQIEIRNMEEGEDTAVAVKKIWDPVEADTPRSISGKLMRVAKTSTGEVFEDTRQPFFDGVELGGEYGGILEQPTADRTYTLRVNNAPDWENAIFTFNKLPKTGTVNLDGYDIDVQYYYYFLEDVMDGFVTSYGANSAQPEEMVGGMEAVTNTKVAEPINIVVSKNWETSGMPNEITIYLESSTNRWVTYASVPGADYEVTGNMQVNDNGNGTYTLRVNDVADWSSVSVKFKNLSTFNDTVRRPIVYRVREEKVDGFATTTTTNGTAEKGNTSATIDSTSIDNTVVFNNGEDLAEVTVKKIWASGATAITSVTGKLYRVSCDTNGTVYDNTAVVWTTGVVTSENVTGPVDGVYTLNGTADTDWSGETFQFRKLPKNGTENIDGEDREVTYKYYFLEEANVNYTATYGGASMPQPMADGGTETITNTEQHPASMKVTKVWKNTDGATIDWPAGVSQVDFEVYTAESGKPVTFTMSYKGGSLNLNGETTYTLDPEKPVTITLSINGQTATDLHWMNLYLNHSGINRVHTSKDTVDGACVFTWNLNAGELPDVDTIDIYMDSDWSPSEAGYPLVVSQPNSRAAGGEVVVATGSLTKDAQIWDSLTANDVDGNPLVLDPEMTYYVREISPTGVTIQSTIVSPVDGVQPSDSNPPTVTITNTIESPADLQVKKEWKLADGTVVTNPSVDAVTFKLYKVSSGSSEPEPPPQEPDDELQTVEIYVGQDATPITLQYAAGTILSIDLPVSIANNNEYWTWTPGMSMKINNGAETTIANVEWSQKVTDEYREYIGFSDGTHHYVLHYSSYTVQSGDNKVMLIVTLGDNGSAGTPTVTETARSRGMQPRGVVPRSAAAPAANDELVGQYSLTSANDWSWSALANGVTIDRNAQYYIVEVNVPEPWTPEDGDGYGSDNPIQIVNGSALITLTNVAPVTDIDISITKEWQYQTAEGKPTTNIKEVLFRLYKADGTPVDITEANCSQYSLTASELDTVNGVTYLVSKPSGDTWTTISVKNLSKESYYVVEAGYKDASGNFVAIGDSQASVVYQLNGTDKDEAPSAAASATGDTIKVINKIPDPFTLTVSKTWVDVNGDTITTADGVKKSITVELHQVMYLDGNKVNDSDIVYNGRVEVNGVNGQINSVAGEQTLTNAPDSFTLSIADTGSWTDASFEFGALPMVDDTYTYTFKYYIEETNAGGFQVTYSPSDMTDGSTCEPLDAESDGDIEITNTQPSTGLTVTKKWDDDALTYANKSIMSIHFIVKRNDEQVADGTITKPTTPTAAWTIDGASVDIDKLPVYDTEGNAYTYTVVEDFYTLLSGSKVYMTTAGALLEASYSDAVVLTDGTGTLEITNTLKPSYSLPETGSTGTTPLYALGLSMMLLASCGLMYNQIKRRRREGRS